MKKFWFITILSIVSLALPFFILSQKASAAGGCHNANSPPAFVEDGCTNYWLPYCGPANEFKQFDRCTNESFYLKKEQHIGILTTNARWIWQFGHDGRVGGLPNITSAEGANANDPTGFVNIIRDSLNSQQGTYGHNYLFSNGTNCGESPHPPPNASFDLPPVIWCEIDVAAMLGASQIINNMMGLGADNPAFGAPPGQAWTAANFAAYSAYCPGGAGYTLDRRLNGVNIAKCILPYWKILVDFYASQTPGSPNGYVLFNEPSNYNSGDCRTDAVVYRDHTGVFDVSSPDALDIGSYVNCGEDKVSTFITFYNPDGTQAIRINKFCGNLTGPMSRLQLNLPFSIVPNLQPPTLQPTDESASTAKFDSGYIVGGNYSGSNISAQVRRKFYIKKLSGGAPLPLRADIPDTLSGPELASSRNYPQLGPISVNVGGYTLKAGDGICQSMTIDPGGGTYNYSNDTLTTSFPEFREQCTYVSDKPYVKFYGGDVFAGGGFDDGGGCTTTGGIRTYSNTNSTGSGAQFAATALGLILNDSSTSSGFSSANQGTTGTAQAPSGLTFANSNLPLTWNGFFDLSQCFKNYWGPGEGLGNDTAGTIRADDPSSGVHKRHGTLTINADTVSKGKHYIIYVDDNVKITGNIDYDTSWTNENDIPYLIVISKKNIYISSNVHRLNGIFIAQGTPASPTDGTIYTCADKTPNIFNHYLPNSGVPTGANAAHYTTAGTDCNSTLTVNGTFVAKTVKFLRTGNSLRNSTTGENYSSSHGAETFVISPEMYAGSASLCSLIAGICGNGGYDSITSLPPVL